MSYMIYQLEKEKIAKNIVPEIKEVCNSTYLLVSLGVWKVL